MLILANGLKFSIQSPRSEFYATAGRLGQPMSIHEAVSPNYSYREGGDPYSGMLRPPAFA